MREPEGVESEWRRREEGKRRRENEKRPQSPVISFRSSDGYCGDGGYRGSPPVPL